MARMDEHGLSEAFCAANIVDEYKLKQMNELAATEARDPNFAANRHKACTVISSATGTVNFALSDGYIVLFEELFQRKLSFGGRYLVKAGNDHVLAEQSDGGVVLQFLDNKDHFKTIQARIELIRTHFGLQHQNVAEYLGYGTEYRDPKIINFFIFSKAYPYQLAKIMQVKKGTITNEAIQYMTWSLLEAVTFLNSKGPFSVSFGPSNVYFTEHGILKLVGTWRAISMKDTIVTAMTCGEILMSPERLVPPCSLDGEFTSDYISLNAAGWSIGIILHKIVSGGNGMYNLSGLSNEPNEYAITCLIADARCIELESITYHMEITILEWCLEKSFMNDKMVVVWGSSMPESLPAGEVEIVQCTGRPGRQIVQGSETIRLRATIEELREHPFILGGKGYETTEEYRIWFEKYAIWAHDTVVAARDKAILEGTVHKLKTIEDGVERNCYVEADLGRSILDASD